MKNIIKSIYRVAVMTLFLLMVPSGIFAGIVNFGVGFDLYGTYDDNILLYSEEEIDASNIDPDDEILQMHPYININAEGTRSSVIFRYEYFKEWYGIDHPLDRTNDSFHDGYLTANWNPVDSITLTLYDNYKDSLYGLRRDEVPEIRDDYVNNLFEPSIKFDYSDRLSVFAKMNWSYQDYEENPIYVGGELIGYADWDQLGGEIGGEIELLTKTSFLADVSFWSREYANDIVAVESDSNGYDLNAGILQKFNNEMTLKAQIIFSHREYEALALGVTESKYDDMGATIEFKNQISGTSYLIANAFSKFYASERIASSYYRNTGIETEYVRLMGSRLETSFTLHYSTNRYENVESPWSDKFLKGGVTIGYKIAKWSSIRVQYQHSDRDSDHDLDDFTDNLISAYLHFYFDILK